MPRGKSAQAEHLIPELLEVKLERAKTAAEAVKKIGVTEQMIPAVRALLGFLTRHYATFSSLPSRIRAHMALAAFPCEELKVGACFTARIDGSRHVHKIARMCWGDK
jgi:hypothetical protein